MEEFKREIGNMLGDQSMVDNLFNELKINEYIPQLHEKLIDLRSHYFPPTEIDDSIRVDGLNGDTGWPRMRIYENKDDITIEADLSGYNPTSDTMQVELEKDYLIISGERNLVENVNMTYDEIESGSYRRRVKVFEDVKRENIKASYKNGVLSIVVPRPEPIPIYQIKIDITE